MRYTWPSPTPRGRQPLRQSPPTCVRRRGRASPGRRDIRPRHGVPMSPTSGCGSRVHSIVLARLQRGARQLAVRPRSSPAGSAGNLGRRGCRMHAGDLPDRLENRRLAATRSGRPARVERISHQGTSVSHREVRRAREREWIAPVRPGQPGRIVDSSLVMKLRRPGGEIRPMRRIGEGCDERCRQAASRVKTAVSRPARTARLGTMKPPQVPEPFWNVGFGKVSAA